MSQEASMPAAQLMLVPSFLKGITASSSSFMAEAGLELDRGLNDPLDDTIRVGSGAERPSG